MKSLHMLAWWLAVVGGLNWGLIGLGNLLGGGNWNLVEKVLGGFSGVADVVYVLVGASALLLLWGKVSK